MGHILGIRRPVPIGEVQRTTPFEVFFDLVFAFAFIRVATFMAGSPTPLVLVQGLVFLMLLWWPFTTFAWLANRVRADVGLVRAGLVVVMAAMFVAGLIIPYAWGHGRWTVSEALTVAVAYIVIRTVFYLLNWHVAVVNPRIPAPGFRYAIPIAGAGFRCCSGRCSAGPHKRCCGPQRSSSTASVPRASRCSAESDFGCAVLATCATGMACY